MISISRFRDKITVLWLLLVVLFIVIEIIINQFSIPGLTWIRNNIIDLGLLLLLIVYPFLPRNEDRRITVKFNAPMLLGFGFLLLGVISGYIQNALAHTTGNKEGQTLLILGLIFSPVGWILLIGWATAIILRLLAVRNSKNLKNFIASARIIMIVVCAFLGFLFNAYITAPPPDESGG